ncbi:unnamed protein product [Gongylonema pulchrum]|uniref:Uncharacterized protein n=1 Tax=Gongylonema pulchrum TaxID=637853 RepID=A0A183DYT4_9BILA|nr:unnamed protein product [Gongylonema pulchrum]
MFCCPKSVFERQDDLRRMRQNSASNLDPYRRPPLPPIRSKNVNGDGFVGSFLPPRRLEPVKTTESHLSVLAENTSMLADNRDRADDSDLYGINITGIRGVPTVPVEHDRRRPLPAPHSDFFNHL